MPSAKPDAKEINALRVKRGYSYPDHSPLYEELHVQCESATKEGYTTSERAAILLEYLQTNPHVASVYQNNILTRLLQEGCKEGKWSPEIEHDILYLIHSLYLEYGKCNNSTLGVGIGVENGILRIEQSNRPRPPTGLSFIHTWIICS